MTKKEYKARLSELERAKQAIEDLMEDLQETYIYNSIHSIGDKCKLLPNNELLVKIHYLIKPLKKV